MGRQIVLDGLLERSDTEVLFFGARRHMCLMCTHVAHQAIRQNFEKKTQNFQIFLGFENFSKFFPDIKAVSKNRQRNISFQSRARLSKIKENN